MYNKTKKEHVYYVYIAANQRQTVLYTGVTNGLTKRFFQHKDKNNKNSFTARYNVDKIVYYEIYGNINGAIAREKQIKAGSRLKKIELINSINPDWRNIIKEAF